VLVLGGSGSGKSRLSIQLLEMGGWLVADDAVEVIRRYDRLWASCPATIRGQLEMRGLGLLAMPSLAATELHLVARLAGSVKVDRLPVPASTGILGTELPLITIAPHELVRAGSFVSAALARLLREVT
jgi:serine kinase of HPr protein (carbohydrate metabolism regulator)